MLFGALSSTLTGDTAIGALALGIVVAVVGPWFAYRFIAAKHATLPSDATSRWLLIGGVELVAAILLFSSGHAFGIIPTLSTIAKIGIVVSIALLLSAFAGLLQRAFR